MTEKRYNTGSIIYIEGDEHIEKLYFVKTGAVQLVHNKLKHYAQKIIVKPGDFFGHISCLSAHPRINTAITIEDSVIAEFTKDQFFAAIFNNPDISLKILHGFASQLQIYDNLILSNFNKYQQRPHDQSLFLLGKTFLDQSMPHYAAFAFSQYCRHYPSGNQAEAARSQVEALKNQGILANRPEDFAFANEQIIFCEHEPADYLYYIKSGSVKIVKTSNDKQITLSILPEGSIFGELGIISDKPRNATAISYGPCTLLPISLENFTAVVKNSIPIIKKIIFSLSQRLWFTLTRLDAKLFDNPITKAYILLENKLLEMRVSLSSNKKAAFPFGLDDLFEMIEASPEQKSNLLQIFTHDPNFAFAFREITVYSPNKLSSKSKFYQIRDKFNNSAATETAETELGDNDAVANAGALPEPGLESASHNQYTEVNRSYSGVEKIAFRIGKDFAPGVYKAIVEDESGKFTKFKRSMKPGEELRFIFNRKGSAKVTVFDNENVAFKVFLFNADVPDPDGERSEESLG